MDIRFLGQLTDAGGRYFAAPQRFCNVLYTLDRYAHQVHLNESLFHAAFAATVPLNDGGLKGNLLELGHLERDTSRRGSEVTVVVVTAVDLALLVTLVLCSLCEFLCLGFQQFIEVFLYAASYQFLELPLNYFLV